MWLGVAGLSVYAWNYAHAGWGFMVAVTGLLWVLICRK
jgi:hypothetical protein